MSESKPEEIVGADNEKPGSGLSRRRLLKAAAAATPIIMSIKARPASAGPAGPQNSSALSNNMSARPTAR